MTKTDEYGPENPRDWTTDDPTLMPGSIARAPHETPGLLRMWRGGMKVYDITKLMGIKLRPLMKAINSGIEAESKAHHRGRSMHGDLLRGQA
ncbi:hypothetical protein SEA_ANON_77 [Gordonia phage Anon]|nr:hypothetical protein SEA_ANON_77 [Gordonia phage Anon]